MAVEGLDLGTHVHDVVWRRAGEHFLVPDHIDCKVEGLQMAGKRVLQNLGLLLVAVERREEPQAERT